MCIVCQCVMKWLGTWSDRTVNNVADIEKRVQSHQTSGGNIVWHLKSVSGWQCVCLDLLKTSEKKSVVQFSYIVLHYITTDISKPTFDITWEEAEIYGYWVLLFCSFMHRRASQNAQCNRELKYAQYRCCRVPGAMYEENLVSAAHQAASTKCSLMCGALTGNSSGTFKTVKSVYRLNVLFVCFLLRCCYNTW